MADEIFTEQILEPARCAARFIVNIRRFSSSTTTLDGIIFARSNPYYNKAFGEDRITLSVILPEIESVMSLPCSAKEYGEINYGDHIISGVQPIPYVNRMHYAVLSLKKKDQATATALSHLDFLKVSLHDIGKLTHSLAFENFEKLSLIRSD